MSADVYSEGGHFSIIPEWVLEAAISDTAVRLYGLLRRYCDKGGGGAHPSRATLAKRLHRRDEKVVDRALADLAKIGAVRTFPRWRSADPEVDTVVRERDEDHRVPTSNGYVVNVALTPGVPSLQREGGGGSSAPRGGGSSAPRVGAPEGDELKPLELEPLELESPLPPAAAPVAVVDAPSSTSPARTSRGARVPEDFEPTPAMVEWARANAPQVPRSEHERFMDYWRAQPGSRGVKLDWPATWRNWMRTAQERTPTARAAEPKPSTTDQRVAAGLALAAKYQALDDARHAHPEIGA